MFIAKDSIQFKNLFTQKLLSMLADDALGAFILVLANSLQDKQSSEALAADLEKIFSVLKSRYQDNTLDATDDDLSVFQQLLGQNINTLPVWKTRQAGRWEVTLNTMRVLRPSRSSAQILTSIQQVFDASRFHFNQPFLKPEILWQAQRQGVELKVLYNKFPFSAHHLLIVIAPEKNQPQYLTRVAHDYIFELVASMQAVMPGFATGYNSLAAGASVNHLHFQGFVRPQPFPVESAHWSHNGGQATYPVTCMVANSAPHSWQIIEKLQQNNQPYNCLFRSGRFYILPRPFQGTVKLPDWLKGCGWLDLCGLMTVSDAGIFENLDEHAITQALHLLQTDD